MEDKYIDNKAILERLYNDKVIDSEGEQNVLAMGNRSTLI